MMQHLKNIKHYFIALTVIWLSPQLISQKLAQQPTAENRKPVQVIVSGNHPDAIDNGETVIYDNRKGIDLRSFERPIKTTVPPLESEPEAEPVNNPGESPSEHGEKYQEVSGSGYKKQTELYEDTLRIQMDDAPLPENIGAKQESPESVSGSSVESNEGVQQFMDQGTKYTGTAAQNIFLMNALGIKPGWAKGARWPDGTKVDDFSIVDWIKYGMGESVGISRVATMQNRKKFYATYYRPETE